MARLKPGTKLQLLRRLLTRESLASALRPLSAAELLSVHRFVWEKTLEFGIKTRGRYFPQETVHDRLKEIARAHHDRQCPADLKYCSPEECHDHHPDCARTVTLQQIHAMEQMTREFFEGGA